MSGIQNYNTIVSALTQFASAHLSLKRFDCSFFEQFEQFSSSDKSFPILYAIPNDMSMNENIDIYSFRIYCVDLLQKDRSNQGPILNETLLVLRDLVNWFRQAQDTNLNILNDPRAIPINNFLQDLTLGWYIDIDIEADSMTTDCSIPFSDNFIFSGFSCNLSQVTPYLTCDTLEICQTFIDLEDRVTNLEAVLFAQNSLISGGASFLSGLTYSVSDLQYVIQGALYSSLATQVTTSSGDTTFDRIDVIVADVNGVVSIVEGTPSENPVQPDIDETSQVLVAIITVAAGSTSNATPFTLIYNENAGAPYEWGMVSNSAPTQINPSATNVAYTGTTSIYFSAATNGAQIIYSAASSTDVSVQNTLQFAIKNPSAWLGSAGSRRLRLRVYSTSGVQLGTHRDVFNGQFGFSSTSTAWQILSIPLAAFSIPVSTIGRVGFQVVNTSGNVSFNIDYVTLVVGVQTPAAAASWFNILSDSGTTVTPTIANDSLRISGGTNITSVGTAASKIVTINLDPNIVVTSISATTYYGINTGFSGWTGGTGLYSIRANNNTTTASGVYSVAEGGNTVSSGLGSHAEGIQTTATSNGAHAEGVNTKALGNQSHAEGTDTIASGTSAHAEGSSTIAGGAYSHAEGVSNFARGDYSHTEGSSNISRGIASHTEGSGNIATGDTSHAEGNNTYSLGYGSHSEGQNTTAYSQGSHSEGGNTYANYPYVASTTLVPILSAITITASDPNNISIAVVLPGDVAAEWINYIFTQMIDFTLQGGSGPDLVIHNYNSFAPYYDSGTDSTYIVNFDLINNPDLTFTQISGNQTINNYSNYDYGHAEGQGTTAIGPASHAEGINTLANGVEYINTPSPITVVSAITITTSDPQNLDKAVVFAGDVVSEWQSYLFTFSSSFTLYGGSDPDLILNPFATASLYYDSGTNSTYWVNFDLLFQPNIDFFQISGDTFINVPLPFGRTSHSEGENTTASGAWSHAEGLNTTASGKTAHAEGYFTTAQGHYSHAEGKETSAIGGASHAEGDTSFATGYAAHAEGYGTDAIADGAHAEGFGCIADGPTDTFGVHAEGYVTSAWGTGAHAEGFQTIASGQTAHAEGYQSRALASGAHAEGGGTDNLFTTFAGGRALGLGSHAEGRETTASGEASHAEGQQTIAIGDASHAEGYNTTAQGDSSHSEGTNTVAIGGSSHAEGDHSTANGIASHSEGFTTIAQGDYSHAEGFLSQATGSQSHAEGISTNAVGNSSHAEGGNTQATGEASHSEGKFTNAIGTQAHAEGFTTIASGDNSHSEGMDTLASATASHAEGNASTASGAYSHSEGQSSVADGQAAHAEGFGTSAMNQGSHSEGKSTVSTGEGSHSEGIGSLASGQASHAEGYETDATGAVGAHSEGYQTLASGDASHAEGNSTTANAAGAHSEGQSTTASAVNSHAEGVSTTASGTNGSHAEGNFTVAAGISSHAEGEQTSAAGYTAHAEGYHTQAIGNASHSEGDLTQAIGLGSHSQNHITIAQGDWSHAGGFESTASGITSFVHSTNSIAGGARSAVLGGSGITGTTDDTVYVPYLNVRNIYNATPVATLCVDGSGNVVSASTEALEVTARNSTGSMIPKGSVVYVNGGLGNRPTIALAQATGVTTASIIGITKANIANNADGLVVVDGIMENLNTSAFSVGDKVYLSPTTPGGLVNVVPTSPNIVILVAVITRSNASQGALILNKQYTFSIDRLVDVTISGATSGQTLTYNGTAWVNRTPSTLNINGNAYDLTANREWRTGLADTGALTYSGLTIASSTGKTVNIGACTGYIVDNETNPAQPTYTYVTYSGETNKLVTTVSGGVGTYVLLTSGGTIQFQNTFPTSAERKRMIYLSKLGHPNLTTLTFAINEVDFINSPTAQFRDLFQAFNYVNDGVYPSLNGANLNLNLSAGNIHGDGIYFVTDKTKPNEYPVAAQSPLSFIYINQTGSTGGFITAIDPTTYDNAGVTTSVGGGTNNSTNQYIYYVPGVGVGIQRGQTVYASLTEAISAAQTESFIVFPNFVKNAILIGILSLRHTTTNLSDTAYARLLLADKLGQKTGAAAGLSITTLQQAYNNSASPEIITNSTLDGIEIQGGTGSDTDKNLIMKNNAGVETGSWKADGTLSATTILGDSYSQTWSFAQAGTFADLTTYYFGGLPTVAPTTTADNRRMYVDATGSIKGFKAFIFVNGTLSSSEANSLYIRINNTTDYLVSSGVTFDSVRSLISSNSLNIPVTVGDYYEMKLVNVNMATNPTNILGNGSVFLRT